MNQITCNVITDLLELYSDEIVSEDTKNLVDDHLSNCSVCNVKLAKIRQNLNIPADVNVEPMKKIKRKIKKKNIIVSLVSIVAAAAILLGAFSFITKYKIAIPYEQTHIYSVEQGDSSWEILVHYIDNIEEYYIYGKLLDDTAMEYYIYFSDTYYSRYLSNSVAAKSVISVPAYEHFSTEAISLMGFEIINQPQSEALIEVQTVRIYYCTFGGKNGRMDFNDRYLIWEK